MYHPTTRRPSRCWTKAARPRAPTRPSRARRWLEIGKAVRCRKHGRFAVQLVNHQADDCTVPEMTLGIDPALYSKSIMFQHTFPLPRESSPRTKPTKGTAKKPRKAKTKGETEKPHYHTTAV